MNNRGHLVPKQVVDKNGLLRSVRVRPEAAKESRVNKLPATPRLRKRSLSPSEVIEVGIEHFSTGSGPLVFGRRMSDAIIEAIRTPDATPEFLYQAELLGNHMARRDFPSQSREVLEAVAEARAALESK